MIMACRFPFFLSTEITSPSLKTIIDYEDYVIDSQIRLLCFQMFKMVLFRTSHCYYTLLCRLICLLYSFILALRG